MNSSIRKQLLLLTFALFSCTLTFGQNCMPSGFTPDLALTPATPAVMAEINQIYLRASNRYLGTSAPSAAAVNSAINSYNNLKIVVDNGTINGNVLSDFKLLTFIKTMIARLKFVRTDAAMVERVNNFIWWVNVNTCRGTLVNGSGYDLQDFTDYAVFAAPYLTSENKKRLWYVYQKHWLEQLTTFWQPATPARAFNTDFIYTQANSLIGLCKNYDTEDEQYRHMRAVKRAFDRFASYTDGKNDGLKADGTGFHHWNNYEAYMYAYQTYAKALTHLRGTTYQIEKNSYLRIRTAFLHKLFLGNESGITPLSMTGRTGKWGDISLDAACIKELAVTGGQILGLSTADPVLAGIYNRRYGVDASFNYSTKAPLETGFYQMNHTNGGVFRKPSNIVVVAKGFSNQFWGSEIYVTSNRYGRYQSYGALTVVLPGAATASGFNAASWDWRHNPGTTTKLLSYAQLQAATKRIDEYQSKGFAGALNFQQKDYGMLNGLTGNYGIFAMDFQERTGQGFSGYVGTDTHDASFVFKKSAFFFDDVIICLGSDIKSNDASNHIVTTLYQNNASANNVTVNGTSFTAVGTPTTYAKANDNWVLDNFNTGYYLVAEGGDMVIKRGSQQSPAQGATNANSLQGARDAAIGYIDHGVKPTGAGYEYVLMPKTTASEMQAMQVTMQNTSTKPYEVLQKNIQAHIIKHRATGIYALSLFAANATIPTDLTLASTNTPCLIMYKPDGTGDNLQLSLANPNVGSGDGRNGGAYPTRVIQVTLNGAWDLATSDSRVTLVSNDGVKSIFNFATSQGLPIEVNFSKTVLPVKLDQFSARVENMNVRLDWNTVGEANSDHFKIMRSFDGQQFQFIPGQMAAAGNSNQELHYKMLDFSPRNGINYYRLHLYNKDGSSEILDKIVSANVAGKILEIKNALIQNEQLTAEIYAPAETHNAKLTLFDASGKNYGSMNTFLNEGTNSINMPLKAAPGLFILTLKTAEKSLTKKIIKER